MDKKLYPTTQQQIEQIPVTINVEAVTEGTQGFRFSIAPTSSPQDGVKINEKNPQTIDVIPGSYVLTLRLPDGFAFEDPAILWSAAKDPVSPPPFGSQVVRPSADRRGATFPDTVQDTVHNASFAFFLNAPGLDMDPTIVNNPHPTEGPEVVAVVEKETVEVGSEKALGAEE